MVKSLKKPKNIKLVLTDVDGVLTDGSMYYSSKGEIFKKFHTHDGMAIELLKMNSLKIAFITRENSVISKSRAKKLDVKIYSGINCKENHLQKICAQFNVKPNEIAYIGDDINDYEIMRLVGFTGTPHNSLQKIKNIADYVCKLSGGNGAFREFSEFIINGKNVFNK